MPLFSQLILISPSVTAYALGCVFIAAIARGFSGFGFTLLAIMSLSFVMPLAMIVPAMFVLEIAAGVRLLPVIWGKVHWASIRVLVVASVLATPLGAYLLVKIPGEVIKVVLASLIVLCCAVLISGFKLRRMPSALQTAATGAGAGVLNGALGLGGPPVIVFFLGSPLALEAGRASIIAAFLAMDVAALPAFWAMGLFSRESLHLGLMSLPVLMAGVSVGAIFAKRTSEDLARKIIIAMLLLMALASLAL
ncbi:MULTISPECIES: sulfite exporter TauE/SafE family protein [Pseudomonas]|uniref:Membrane protein YfcA n=1 Tax=Pseudomonas hunanensis TaxID=1247546 RepID=A0ACC6JZX2_9PSED|nr:MULTISPECIES: sulfite exporter TauE/SafE family protein [Pseudomonas]MBP2261627.1 putative membrane protein YfcA [Pseudomonas sp. BP8]MDR6711725.1 putative membrane protein YfcA [Pseudomonas hunanensis]HDS1733529.1 sulfite exporter TauE/SafE family protein [Pseudomonas putida]